MEPLTSAGVGLHILHTADGRMVAVTDERRDSVQQTVDVPDMTRVTQPVLQRSQAPRPMFIPHSLHGGPAITQPLFYTPPAPLGPRLIATHPSRTISVRRPTCVASSAGRGS